jgi:hypothetical protein
VVPGESSIRKYAGFGTFIPNLLGNTLRGGRVQNFVHRNRSDVKNFLSLGCCKEITNGDMKGIAGG